METLHKSAIVKRVREWMDEPGNTAELMAAKLGCSKQAVLNKVNGDVDFWFLEAIKAAELIGCEVSDFVE